jgi:hypothetical protein
MSIAMPSKSIAFDYDIIDNDGGGSVGGNGVDNEINYQETDYDANINKAARWNNQKIKRDPENYEVVFTSDNKKRNILSALRAKIRRSNQISDVEEKFKFQPVLSVRKFNKTHPFIMNDAPIKMPHNR